MDRYKEKRDSLELFLKEQIIGPGAYNLRYLFLNDIDDNYLSKRIGFKDVSEVIPEVPAYKYSSGILFPISNFISDDDLEEINVKEEEDINSDDDEEDKKGADDENIKSYDEENLISNQQNYPNSCGLSFVVGFDSNIEKDIEVSINYRRYTNISISSALKKKFAYRITEYKDEFKRLFDTYFIDLFLAEEKDGNLFICPREDGNIKDSLCLIDYVMYNSYLKNEIIPFFEKFFGHYIKIIAEKSTPNYKTYGIENGDSFYEIYCVQNKKCGDEEFDDVITIFDNNIVRFLKNKLQNNITEYDNVKILIYRLEILKQLKEILDNIKLIFIKKGSAPLWQSKHYSHSIILPVIEKENFIIRSKPLDIDGVDELKYSYQYITRKEDGKVYIKIVIINNACVQIKDNGSRFLNKKNEVNKKSFFGIELKIKELKKNILKQYNPPNLIDFDDEENLNKLLYRQYVDFGEGYNTSVNWGENDEGLKYISTDYLPKQETPKVDFKPSKIKGSKIVSRIVDDTCLSMKGLSYFSNNRDNDVIDSLNRFVDSYKQWIDEKKIGLEDKESLKLNSDAGLDLLKNQIKAVERDYQRLKRNITLLEKDEKAMSAFRVMNSAMFMQLHHKIMMEKNEVFIPETNEEIFYKNLFLENDYKWRSFQLAFILLNVDAFVRPDITDETVKNIFDKGWPERNEVADMVWFPTGGGKTEAYLGIIAFTIAYRRFTKGSKGFGTTVLMRYTLRLLTLQQFQRATMLICALEVIRKEGYSLPHFYTLGSDRISIGLFVGEGSLPNKWIGEKGMLNELNNIKKQLKVHINISTNLPFTKCPWCGEVLFMNRELENVSPNDKKYGINDLFKICCHSKGCAFEGNSGVPDEANSLPLRLLDLDIYKFPPTLLFGTVDKFAALANKVNNKVSERDQDSRRLVGNGHNMNNLPPELIIQDELHLLLGPLGSAVALYEKAIDKLCSYKDNHLIIRPKIITSTATTRNTDKQVFALFNRRSEVFPKQGINCDDSFFAYYKREDGSLKKYESNRKYVGILPVGKTQVWMQLRIASVILAHRVKYLKDMYTLDELFKNKECQEDTKGVMDYYHSVLSYFNSLKDVGKTQSQLTHYLPEDLKYVTQNTLPWSFINKLIIRDNEIDFSELTGRLTGEEVKTNLSKVQKNWSLFCNEEKNKNTCLKKDNPPEFIISTNMISVGLDVSRFNSMIISSMPRNIAEYIQASSRIARDKEGIVFTVHHPFRSRDISHYHKFKEFHEKFYSYVEPISVTPFANSALERYFAMFLAVLIRHDKELGLTNNEDAANLDEEKVKFIKAMILTEIQEIKENAAKLDEYLRNRDEGIRSSIDGILGEEEFKDIQVKLDDLLIKRWFERTGHDFKYRGERTNNSLFIDINDICKSSNWKVKNSLREIAPATVIKTVQQ